MTKDEMGHQDMGEHGFCEFPGCDRRAIETWYCMNPEPPPLLVCAALCGECAERVPMEGEAAARFFRSVRLQAAQDLEQHID